MCTNPIEIWRKSPATGRAVRTIVPCGKCFDCLNKRQNDNAVLSYLEAVKRGKLVFATLTYSNDTFPIMERAGIVRFDGQQEEVEWQERHFVYDSERLKKLRDLYVDCVGEDFSQVIRSNGISDSSGNLLISEFCPSLCRKDFQSLLKRSRVNYERSHGESLPDFSYMLVGEYGEQHHRPHYHCCFYGLEEVQVIELLSEWKSLYGYIDVKEVKRFNGDPSHDGFFAASRYLGKYLTKGESDSFNVLCGLAEKSRVMRSISFGIPDRKQLASLLSFTALKILQDCHAVNKLKKSSKENI